MGPLAKQGEILTIDNWGPDWRRISDGRYLERRDDSKERVSREEYKISKHKKCKATCDGKSIMFDCVNDLALFLGRNSAIVSKAFGNGHRVRSSKTNIFYTVEKV